MRSMRSVLAAAMLATALTSAPNAWACLCVLDPLDPAPLLNPATASVSFIGIAGPTLPKTDPAYLAWTFDVEVPLRGLPSDGVAVELFNDGDPRIGNSCEQAFDEGTRYHVWADPGPNGNLRIATCGPGGFSSVP